MRPKSYYCEVYGFKYVYFLGWKFKDFLKYIIKNYNVEINNDDSASGKTLFLTHQNRSHILIWISHKNNLPCLAHECVHAANFTLDHIGVHPSFKNDEAQAYLVDTIFKEGITK